MLQQQPGTGAGAVDSGRAAQPLYCPSAQPDTVDGVLLGLVQGADGAPRVSYLDRRHPVTPELLEAAAPARPTEVFRMAAPCAGAGCQHYDGARCRLVQRTVQLLPPVVDELPPCILRSFCRWWKEEGRAACLRCPQVTTDVFEPSAAQLAAGQPIGNRKGNHDDSDESDSKTESDGRVV